MRKVIFLNFPTHGCINSLLATAKELINRGEKVIYYCGEEFRDKIEQTGAEFRPYKGKINTFKVENNDLFKAMKLNVIMTLDKMDHHLEEIRNENPDYIIHDSLCTWGKYLAKLLGIPAVNLMHSYPITSASISLNRETIPLMTKIGLHKFRDIFYKSSPKKILREKYNIRLSFADTMINREKMNIVYTSKYMDREIYQKEKDYFYVGPSLFFKNKPSDFPFDALRNKEVIYISLGTMHNNNTQFYRKCMKAFSNSHYTVVISIGFETNLEAISKIPENFIIRQSVPQQQLLSFVDVFITHAGMNSVNEAICAGVPMILLPHQLEQNMIARKVQELGMGIIMNIKRVSPSRLQKKVNMLISEKHYRNQALKYQDEFTKDEQISHRKAADKIIHFINTTLSLDNNRNER